MDDRCRGKSCGAKITWGVTEEGKRVPLDLRPPIYTLGERDPVTGCRKLVRLEKGTVGVSHFATCRDVAQFSGGGRTAMGAAMDDARERKGGHDGETQR